MRTQELLKLKWSFKLLAASYIPQEQRGRLIYLIQIFTVDANSQSEVEVGQFGREDQKQRSFGVKSTAEGGVRKVEGSKNREGGCKIEIVFTDSESEVEIGQFGREGQKQRSFDQKSKYDTRI